MTDENYAGHARILSVKSGAVDDSLPATADAREPRYGVPALQALIESGRQAREGKD